MVHAVSEETEGRFGLSSFSHDAQGGAGSDVDGGEAGLSGTGAEVTGGAVTDAWEPGDSCDFREHLSERAFDGGGQIMNGRQCDGVEVTGFEQGRFPREFGWVVNAGAGCHPDRARSALCEFGLEPFCGCEPKGYGAKGFGLGAFEPTHLSGPERCAKHATGEAVSESFIQFFSEGTCIGSAAGIGPSDDASEGGPVGADADEAVPEAGQTDPEDWHVLDGRFFSAVEEGF